MPNLSLARKSFLNFLSHKTKANIPEIFANVFLIPHFANASTKTSVSELPKKLVFAISSSFFRSRKL